MPDTVTRLLCEEPQHTAKFYADVLGFSVRSTSATRVHLQLGDMTLFVDQGQAVLPGRISQVDLRVDLDVIKAAVSYDSLRMGRDCFPDLDRRGVFVYVTEDPSGTRVVLNAPVLSAADPVGLGLSR